MHKVEWVKAYRALTGAYLKEAVNVYNHYTNNGKLNPPDPEEVVGMVRSDKIKSTIFNNHTIVVGFNTPTGIVEKTFTVSLSQTRDELDAYFNSLTNGAPDSLRLGNLLLRNFSYFYIS